MIASSGWSGPTVTVFRQIFISPPLPRCVVPRPPIRRGLPPQQVGRAVRISFTHHRGSRSIPLFRLLTRKREGAKGRSDKGSTRRTRRDGDTEGIGRGGRAREQCRKASTHHALPPSPCLLCLSVSSV